MECQKPTFLSFFLYLSVLLFTIKIQFISTVVEDKIFLYVIFLLTLWFMVLQFVVHSPIATWEVIFAVFAWYCLAGSYCSKMSNYEYVVNKDTQRNNLMRVRQPFHKISSEPLPVIRF